MSSVAFDTLKFANQLQAGNFTPEQAQAMTGAMVEAMAGAELATKHDIAAVKADLVILEQWMTIKLGGMMMAMAAIIIAAIRYLPLGH